MNHSKWKLWGLVAVMSVTLTMSACRGSSSYRCGNYSTINNSCCSG
ncbi:hypothetical protein [Paenibacillus psychroresistens]|nr:hypothetical protein [Paenibacillus psychroresistens]